MNHLPLNGDESSAVSNGFLGYVRNRMNRASGIQISFKPGYKRNLAVREGVGPTLGLAVNKNINLVKLFRFIKCKMP